MVASLSTDYSRTTTSRWSHERRAHIPLHSRSRHGGNTAGGITKIIAISSLSVHVNLMPQVPSLRYPPRSPCAIAMLLCVP